MIIAHTEYRPESDIQVRIHRRDCDDPFIMSLTFGTSIHLSLHDVQRLHLELTAALYEWDEE